MLEAEHFIFCAAVQESSQGQDFIGVFDIIYATKFPARHQPFRATVWLRAKKALVQKDINAHIVIERENEKIGEQTNVLQNATAEKDNTLMIGFDFSGIVFPQAGRYYFKLYIDEKLAISRVLRVKDAKETVEP
jgi:cytidylate kinase